MIAPAISAITGSLAPQGTKVVVMMVILLFFSSSMVRAAIMPGTPQPEEISKRNKALAGQAKPAEYTVHDKCHPRHIAAVLQYGQKEKQDRHLRGKSDRSR